MKGRLEYLTGATLLATLALALPARAQVVTWEDVNPSSSTLDPSDPDGATGGRTNGLATVPGDNQTLYAATEWGGIYKTTDGGLTWARLNGHLPTATWDVEVDPSNASRVVATSFFDGRTTSLSGINVSTDGGTTWTHPATATPPASFCAVSADRTERAAFGIAFDPDAPANVYVGTSCGLAVSTDSGATWSFVDPTPGGASAARVWDVIVHDGGIIDVCGDDGHLRSTNGGSTWTAGSGLPSGMCSLAVSPDESYVLLATAGTLIYETDNADSGSGATWAQLATNPSPQGRIPFVVTNQRSDVGATNVFDLWFGDVSLYRATCTTPAVPASGGSPRCPTSSATWAGPFTRAVGAHDDMGYVVFDSEATNDACPVLMSSDGGVYRNTTTTSPTCHTPTWEQPNTTPHALWLFGLGGADQSGVSPEDLYFGNQDNGVFFSSDAGASSPTWGNQVCCDGFDAAAEPTGVVYSVCCFGGGGRSTRFYRRGSGMIGGGELNTYPAGGLPPGFKFPDSIISYDGAAHAMITRDCSVGVGGCPGADGGLFVTADIGGAPIVWTELGNATEPSTAGVCGVKSALDGSNVPTFFVQVGDCNSRLTTDQLWKFTGTNPAGTWTQLNLPSGGFGVFGVDPKDPDVLIASGLTSSGFAMYSSNDGGASWSPMAQLDTLMTGAGDFVARSTRGPSDFTGFNGYWQPSLVEFDPVGNNVVAAGKESGVFLSTDGGATWSLVSDPIDSDTSGVPHLPRPWYAYYDFEVGENTDVYVGTQGRGVWRMTIDATTPAFTVDDVTVTEGDAGGVNATFTVSLTPAAGVQTTVDWATQDNTAVAPGDYTAAGNTLTFTVGATTQTFDVTVLGDTVDEADETFRVNLSGASGAVIADGIGFGTIQDDDPAPSLAIGDVSLAEGDSGTKNFVFPVMLSTVSGQAVQVDYATADGTATSGVASSSGPGVAIVGGVESPYPSDVSVSGVTATVTKVTVEIADFGHTWPLDVDVLLVGPGGQSVVLMSDVGGGGPGISGIDILFDDTGVALPATAFPSGTYQPTNLDEGDGDPFPAPAPGGPYGTTLSVFDGVDPNGTWRLYVFDDFPGIDDGSLASWTLNVQTDGGDYTATSGTLTILAGSGSGNVTVQVLGDTDIELDETFDVILSNPVAATISDGTGTGTILDDDDPASIIFQDGFESGNTNAWSAVVP